MAGDDETLRMVLRAMESLETRFDRLYDSINGNGKVGLLTRVHVNEENIRDVEKCADRLEAQIDKIANRKPAHPAEQWKDGKTIFMVTLIFTVLQGVLELAKSILGG